PPSSPLPPPPTLFPYTTLFRSGGDLVHHLHRDRLAGRVLQREGNLRRAADEGAPGEAPREPERRPPPEEHQIPGGERAEQSEARSEEHTSELQSRFDLVCRLLL